jgi:hypothetical protein
MWAGLLGTSFASDQNMDYIPLTVTGHPQSADYCHPKLDDGHADYCLAR